jgi:hypothetical protein
MALNCFQNSAEPINDYKVSVGAFVGNVGKDVGGVRAYLKTKPQLNLYGRAKFTELSLDFLT